MQFHLAFRETYQRQECAAVATEAHLFGTVIKQQLEDLCVSNSCRIGIDIST